VRNLPAIPIQPFGAVIPVQIGVSAERRRALRAQSLTEPEPILVTLLIDTGATCSWVRPVYMSQLGLSPRSWIDVDTPKGVEENQPAYEVSLVLGGIGTPNAKRFETLIGGTEFSNMPFDGLLGRNILRELMIAWSGPSETVRIQYE
jgi:hypothetical protein